MSVITSTVLAYTFLTVNMSCMYVLLMLMLSYCIWIQFSWVDGANAGPNNCLVKFCYGKIAVFLKPMLYEALHAIV